MRPINTLKIFHLHLSAAGEITNKLYDTVSEQTSIKRNYSSSKTDTTGGFVAKFI